MSIKGVGASESREFFEALDSLDAIAKSPPADVKAAEVKEQVLKLTAKLLQLVTKEDPVDTLALKTGALVRSPELKGRVMALYRAAMDYKDHATFEEEDMSGLKNQLSSIRKAATQGLTSYGTFGE
jgi:muconolactone delta-isomerase